MFFLFIYFRSVIVLIQRTATKDNKTIRVLHMLEWEIEKSLTEWRCPSSSGTRALTLHDVRDFSISLSNIMQYPFSPTSEAFTSKYEISKFM